MPACGYEFYLLVFDSISHSFPALTREISSWTLEDKIHIHARSCNLLYILFIQYPPDFADGFARLAILPGPETHEVDLWQV